MSGRILAGFFPDLYANSPQFILDVLDNDCQETPIWEGIAHPGIAIASVIGVSVGLYFGRALQKRSQSQAKFAEADLFYSYSFYFFAMMNFSALFFHCLTPPSIYLYGKEGMDTPNPYDMLTKIMRVVDFSATGSSCLAFIIGRLFQIKHSVLGKKALVPYYHVFFLVLFLFGFVGGLERNIPFTGEILYPGIMIFTALVIPCLQWTGPQYKALVPSFLSAGLAFGIPLFELPLCTYVGSFFLGPPICFLFCDLLFLSLAKFLGV